MLVLAAGAAPQADAVPSPADVLPLFTVGVGASAPLAGSDENRLLLPCGAGPASFQVDGEGRWWVLDSIGGRVQVFARDGSVVRSVALAGEKVPHGRQPYAADLALDGAGGFFLLDAGAKRIVHFDQSGARVAGWGAEALPKAPHGGDGFALLDLPVRIAMEGGEVVVEDAGSDARIHFRADGTFLSAIPGAIAGTGLPGGWLAVLTGDESPRLELLPPDHAARRQVAIEPRPGHELISTELVGGTPSGDVVVAVLESPDPGLLSVIGAPLGLKSPGGSQNHSGRRGGQGAGLGSPTAPEGNAEAARILRFDREGKLLAERALPPPDDGVTPTRRFRITPSGRIAWFHLGAGRFEAFETDSP